MRVAVNEAGNYTKPRCGRTYLIVLRLVEKVVPLVSGQREKPKCLLVNIKNVVVVIPVEKK